MIEVKYVTKEDKNFWYSLDKHLPENEFDKKIRDKQGYVLFDDGVAVGLLRYNTFEELFEDFNIEIMADKSMTKQELLNVLEEFYTPEKQKQYGVVGIRIEKI